MKSPEELHPDWARYPETIVKFGGDDGLGIDLREPVSPQARDALARRGLGEPFAILTAHDPMGESLPAEENAKRQAELEDLLRESAIDFERVDCCSPDGEHCECSVAIAVDQETAVDLAMRFDQVAIFWWDGERFWIVGGVMKADPVVLPRSS